MIKIYNEDCLKTMARIPNNYIDLTITSPPYNVDLGNNKYHKNPYDLYNDNKKHKDYILFLSKIFKTLYKKLKKGGRVCINIGDGKNGGIPTSSDIIQKLTEIGYIPMTHIIWHKYQMGSRTSWGSFMSPSSPSFPTPFEHILVFCKESKKLASKGVTDLKKEEFIQWTNSLWEFPPETNQNKYGHNAMFPLELPIRCLKMFSWIDSTVYDPFSGAGTTAIACKKYNRNFIGSEISKKYCEIAEKRLKSVDSVQIDLF